MKPKPTTRPPAAAEVWAAMGVTFLLAAATFTAVAVWHRPHRPLPVLSAPTQLDDPECYYIAPDGKIKFNGNPLSIAPCDQAHPGL